MHRLTIQYDAPADPETFDAQYFDRHVPLCRTIPGLAGVSFCKPRPVGPGSAPYLVTQLDFADLDAFKEAMRSPEMAIVAQDADTLPAERTMFSGDVADGPAA